MKKEFLVPVTEPGLIVLGMHRSGTSCLAGMLQLAGFEAADVEKWNPSNQRGHREYLRLVKLNDEVLHRNQADWRHPPESGMISVVEDDLRKTRNEILSEIASHGRPWMFKDPRTLLTLPFWREAIPNPYRLGIFRHPVRVVLSLYYLSQMPVSEGLSLWLTYNRALVSEYERASFPVLCFDLLPNDFINSVVVALRQECDDLVRRGLLELTKMQEFYSRDLVHHQDSDLDEVMFQQPGFGGQLMDAAQLYERLCALASVRGQIKEGSLAAVSSSAPFLKLLKADQAVRDGNIDLGLQLYHETLPSAPDLSSVWGRIIALLRRNNRLSEAVETCCEAVKSCPADPGLMLTLAELKAQTGSRVEALEVIEHVFVISSEWFLPWLRKGEWLYAEGRWKEAVIAFEHSIRLQAPGYFWAHSRLAEALIRAGRTEEGNASFERALELAPVNSHAVINHRWAQVLLVTGDTVTALHYQKRAAALASGAPHIHIGLAKLLRRMGREKEAVACLVRALEKGEDTTPLRLLLAKLAFSLGSRELAGTQLTVIANREPDNSEVVRLKTLWSC